MTQAQDRFWRSSAHLLYDRRMLVGSFDDQSHAFSITLSSGRPAFEGPVSNTFTNYTGGFATAHTGATGTTISSAGEMMFFGSSGHIIIGNNMSVGGSGSVAVASGTVTFSAAGGIQTGPPLLGVPALAVTPVRQELLGLLTQWAEEDAAEPDPGFDIDFAELEAEHLKLDTPR
jgi:hypothetical protein